MNFSLVEFARDLRTNIEDAQEVAWERLLSWFYNRLPTRQGELEESLKFQVQDGLLNVGVRFKAFNRTVGTLSEAGLAFTFILFVPVILFGTLTILSPNWPPAFWMVLAVFTALLGLATASVVFADLLLILYLGSALKFGLQQIRANLVKVEEESFEKYVCGSDQSEISVYVGNYSSFIKGIIYSILFFTIGVIWLLSPLALDLVGGTVALIPAEKIPLAPIVSIMTNIATSIDALLPIDISVLFRPAGLQSLTILTMALLVFAIFLNGKNILQQAERSRFDWSELDEFSATEEVKRCYEITKIIFHHLIHGELTKQFQTIRGEIFEAVISVLIAGLLSVFYLYVFLSSI